METRKPRTFTMVDAMVLITATALGFGAIRAWSPKFYTYQYTPIPPPTWVEWGSFKTSAWAFYLMPMPAALTFATLVLRSLKPRPPLRVAFSRGGSAAVIAATTAISLGFAYLMLDRRRPSWHEMPFEYTTYSAGVAVGAVWAVLAAAGLWTTERDWVDRFGRILGTYWLAMVPVVLFRTFSG